MTTLSRIGCERFSDELFVRVRTVDFGGIEERDALLVGGTNDLDALLPVCRRSVVGADAHAPGPHLRDLQFPELSRLHVRSFREHLSLPLIGRDASATAEAPTATVAAPPRAASAKRSRRRSPSTLARTSLLMFHGLLPLPVPRPRRTRARSTGRGTRRSAAEARRSSSRVDDRVGAGDEAQRGLLQVGDGHQRPRELGGVAALFAVLGLPNSSCFARRSA